MTSAAIRDPSHLHVIIIDRDGFFSQSNFARLTRKIENTKNTTRRSAARNDRIKSTRRVVFDSTTCTTVSRLLLFRDCWRADLLERSVYAKPYGACKTRFRCVVYLYRFAKASPRKLAAARSESPKNGESKTTARDGRATKPSVRDTFTDRAGFIDSSGHIYAR